MSNIYLEKNIGLGYYTYYLKIKNFNKLNYTYMYELKKIYFYTFYVSKNLKFYKQTAKVVKNSILVY